MKQDLWGNAAKSCWISPPAPASGLAYTVLVLKWARPRRAQPGRRISKHTAARPSGAVEDRWHASTPIISAASTNQQHSHDGVGELAILLLADSMGHGAASPRFAAHVYARGLLVDA